MTETPVAIFLWRDHLSHHTAGRVGCRKQHRIEIELPRRDHLEIAEQRVAGRIAAGEEDRDPSEERGQKDEQPADGGGAEGERVSHAGIVHQVGQADDDADSQDREPGLPDRVPDAGE